MTTSNHITPMKSNADIKFHSSGMGYTTLAQLVQTTLDRLSIDEYYPLKELFDDHCIYGAKGKLFRREFTVKADTQQVTLADTATEVIERTTYQPTTDITHSSKAGKAVVMPMAAHGYPGEPKKKQVGITVQTGVKPTDSASQLVTQHLKTEGIPKVTSEVANVVRPMRALGIEYPRSE